MPFKVQVGPPQIAIHQAMTVLVTETNGEIRWPTDKGLYFFDTRLISAWAVYANGEEWDLLNGGATSYDSARMFLTNRGFLTEDGAVPAHSLAFVISRAIDGGLHEDLDLTNHGQRPVRFNLEIAIRSDFADIFDVKAGRAVRRGRIGTDWSDAHQRLRTTYRSRDFMRAVSVAVTRESARAAYANGRLSFEVALAPGASWHACLLYELADAERHFREASGRRVVNGRRVLDLEMSKVEQLAALRAAGFDVPRTVAVAGRAELAAAARKLPVPFIIKPNQGGKGLGVRAFASLAEFEDYLAGPDYEEPTDGITLLQEYLVAAEPRITRAEIVGSEFIYAITADTARGGFELCPADACAIGPGGGPAADPSLFALRAGFDDPIVGRYLAFAATHGIGIAGFEFIETADGRLVTYDVNTTTNYNAEIEAAAPRPALPAVAAYLGRLLAEAG